MDSNQKGIFDEIKDSLELAMIRWDSFHDLWPWFQGHEMALAWNSMSRALIHLKHVEHDLDA